MSVIYAILIFVFGFAGLIIYSLGGLHALMFVSFGIFAASMVYGCFLLQKMLRKLEGEFPLKRFASRQPQPDDPDNDQR